jgi:exodeoxyribonuclease-3
MKLITWNVNGIRAREAELLRLLAEEKPDVVMLQETKATVEQLPASLYGLLGLPEYHSIWHGSAGYSGVSLHLRKATFARPTDSHPAFDFETRVVEAHVADWVFVSMYLPNGGKDFQAKLGFLGALASYPHSFAGKKLVIAGDLNVARTDLDVHEDERKPRATDSKGGNARVLRARAPIGQRPKERELFERFLAAGLVDVCRKLAPDDAGLFTWWPYWNEQRARNVGWRIDYVLANEPLASRGTSVRVRRDFGTSDHAPVIVEFAD